MTQERVAHISHALGMDLTGLVLDERYQILRRLGAGGMATVYEGRRLGLDRALAIKILRSELAIDPQNVRRFLREAQAAAVLDHPNVVSIVDVGGTTPPVYFVMELINGQDLRQNLATWGSLTWDQTRDLGLQIAAALAAAHGKGIIHRDVKPANCMVITDASGHHHVKLLDFGIAKALTGAQDFTQSLATTTGGIMGTVAYMAPEQARGEAVDARTDIYALGTMLYEMLAGTVPFPDRNPFVAVSRQIGDAPQPLRQLRPDLSEEAEAVVMACLAKDPDARFQSMDALAQALRACDPVPKHDERVAPSTGATATSSDATVQIDRATEKAVSSVVQDPSGGTAPARRRLSRAKIVLVSASMLAAALALGSFALFYLRQAAQRPAQSADDLVPTPAASALDPAAAKPGDAPRPASAEAPEVSAGAPGAMSGSPSWPDDATGTPPTVDAPEASEQEVAPEPVPIPAPGPDPRYKPRKSPPPPSERELGTPSAPRDQDPPPPPVQMTPTARSVSPSRRPPRERPREPEPDVISPDLRAPSF